MTRVRHLDDDRVDHRQVVGDRHPVVQERAVHHVAPVVHEVLFVQAPADALGRSALHLPLDVARVDRLARVLRYCRSEHLDLARLRVGLEIDDEPCKCRADARGVDRATPGDGAARRIRLSRQLLERHPQLGVGLRADDSLLHLE